jgi:outer membrane receptor protein involved in Fe transport
MDFQGMTLGGGGDFLVDQYRLHGEIQGFADFAKGKGRIVSGFSLRSEGVDSANKKGIQTVISKARDTHYEAVFGQLDYKFTNKLKVVLASRLDFGSLHKAQISPKASLVYTFNPGHSIRFSFNRAFQRPSYTGLYLKYPVSAPINLSAIEKGISDASGGVDLGLGFQSIPVLALGNENLEMEEIISYEIGYTNIFAQKLIFNINYYRNYLTNFISDMLPFVNPAYGPYTPPSNLSPQVQSVILTTLEQNLPPSLFSIMSNSLEDGSPVFVVLSNTNSGKADVQGVEIGLKCFISDKWNVDINYTWFDYKVKEELIGDIILANTPKHRINLGISYLSKRLDLSMRYRWVDAFPWSEGIFNGEVRSYSLIDFTTNIHLGSGFAFGINISNLLDKKHYQMFGGDIIRRNAVVTLSYRW